MTSNDAPTPQPLTEAEENQLEALAKAATPGPWDSEGSCYIFAKVPGGRPNGEGIGSMGCYTDTTRTNPKADAAFIAHINPVFAYRVIAQLRADRRRIDAMQWLLRRIQQWDMLDTAADGKYWRQQIQAALEGKTK